MRHWPAQLNNEYEAKNPLIRALGTLLPKKDEAAAAAVDDDELGDIAWDAPKVRGLSTEKMAIRLDAGLRDREWFVTGRGLPELFSDKFFFSDPDVSLTGFQPYCRQVRRLFDQQTARAEVVCCAATAPSTITVVWRLAGGVNLGPLGVDIKPYVVTTTLKTLEDEGGLIVSQEDAFALPGYDILLSALLPPLRPLLAPEAPPAAELARLYDPATCTRLGEAAVAGGATAIADAQQAGEEPGTDLNPATKAAWFATEAFGQAAALVRGKSAPAADATTGKLQAPRSLDESVKRLVADYEGSAEDPRPYFLTGRMDVELYDPDCYFADPFVGFSGRDRFVTNLENLAGGFITESSTRTLSSELTKGDAAAGVPPAYSTKLLVKLRLGLPWSPVLAWPWGVKHEFDPQSGLIVRHIESWDVSPQEGVRQLATPGAEKKV